MHKTKDKKIQPVSDSSVTPHAVEGRADWQERARSRQTPNSDQSWRQFQQNIKDRTATFPVGSRVTEEQQAKIKVAD
jgi:hypothetical protein